MGLGSSGIGGLYSWIGSVARVTILWELYRIRGSDWGWRGGRSRRWDNGHFGDVAFAYAMRDIYRCTTKQVRGRLRESRHWHSRVFAQARSHLRGPKYGLVRHWSVGCSDLPRLQQN